MTAPARAVGLALALFGAYHLTHSPPFNAPGMVALLAVVGLVTSAFYLGSGVGGAA
jgi:hypothetical protein